MQKQVVFPRFIPRVFAMTLDLFVLNIILLPVMMGARRVLTYWLFQDFFAAQNLGFIGSMNEAAINMQEFAHYLNGNLAVYYYSLISMLINVSMAIGYFVLFWYKFGQTPGKMFMQMKIVDATTYQSKLTFKQCLKRQFCYFTIPIGIFFMLFTKRGMGLHDKLANTVVIKA